MLIFNNNVRRRSLEEKLDLEARQIVFEYVFEKTQNESVCTIQTFFIIYDNVFEIEFSKELRLLKSYVSSR